MASSNEISSSYRRAILTTEFPLGALLRTPVVSPESMKNQVKYSLKIFWNIILGGHTPSKRGTNQISTVAQVYLHLKNLLFLSIDK